MKNTQTSTTYNIDPALTDGFPGLFYAYTVIRNVSITKTHPDLETLKTAVVEDKKLDSASIKEIPSVRAYRKLFKETGVDPDSKQPSPQALLKRISQGKNLYTINTAVDAYNVAVVETSVGLGGFDLQKISEPVHLRYSKEGETMQLLGEDKETQIPSGSIIYADQQRPITLHINYRDSQETCITEKTKDIILFADGAPGINETVVTDALTKAAMYITQFCGGTVGEITIVK